MYKIVFIDLDGTLLNSQGEITEKTKKALLDAQQKGVMIVLASGRVSSSTAIFARQIGLDGYIISGNGSVITDLSNDEDIYTNCMNKSTALKVIDICEENSIYYSLYTLKDVYTRNILYSTLFYNYENKKLPAEKKIKINLSQNINKTVQENGDLTVSKITICNDKKSIFDSIMRKLRGIPDVEVLDVTHSSKKRINNGSKTVEINYYYTEISKKGVDKWSAIEYLINKLGIDKSEVIAIGDNANDINMIRNAGLGVMMGNAAPIYKEQADYIAPDNNSDGIKDVFDKFIFN